MTSWRHGGHIGIQNKEAVASYCTEKNRVGAELFSPVKMS